MSITKREIKLLITALFLTFVIEVGYIVLTFGEFNNNLITLSIMLSSSVIYTYILYRYKRLDSSSKMHFVVTLISVIIVNGGLVLFMINTLFPIYLIMIILYIVLYNLIDSKSINNSKNSLYANLIIMFILKLGTTIVLLFFSSFI